MSTLTFWTASTDLPVLATFCNVKMFAAVGPWAVSSLVFQELSGSFESFFEAIEMYGIVVATKRDLRRERFQSLPGDTAQRKEWCIGRWWGGRVHGEQGCPGCSHELCRTGQQTWSNCTVVWCEYCTGWLTPTPLLRPTTALHKYHLLPSSLIFYWFVFAVYCSQNQKEIFTNKEIFTT